MKSLMKVEEAKSMCKDSEWKEVMSFNGKRYVMSLYDTDSLSINRPKKRRKEKSPSDGHCQSQKEMDDHLLACQQFLTESHTMTRLANDRASFLSMNDINDNSFFGTSDCHHCCSIA
jgi:hypothetical protein